MKEEFDNLLKTDRCTHSMEYRWLDLKKMPVWIHCKGYLVRDDNMKPLYMIGCINEIGERQKADNVSGLLGERQAFGSIWTNRILLWKKDICFVLESIILRK